MQSAFVDGDRIETPEFTDEELAECERLNPHDPLEGVEVLIVDGLTPDDDVEPF